MLKIKADNEITLKEISIEHAEIIFNTINRDRKYLREWLDWVDDSKILDNTLDYIQAVSNNDMYHGRFVMEIWYKNYFAGIIDYHNGNKLCRHAEIGYWLGEKFQGRGIMTKACKTAVDYGFNDLGLNRIVIKCAEGNIKSQAIPKRLNFTHEGIEREGELLHGRFIDLYIYSMLKKEWSLFYGKY